MAERSIVLRALEALKKACKDLQTNRTTTTSKSSSDYTAATASDPCNSPSMKALLELETKSDRLFFGDPNLSTLSHLLSRLRSLSRRNPKAGTNLLFFLSFPFFFNHVHREISEVAGSIESEIQSWIDRECLGRLTVMLKTHNAAVADEEDEILNILMALDSRLGRGFDKELQSCLLKSKTFEAVESALASSAASKRVKEACALAVSSMVRFNRDVFVGLVLLGGSVRLLLDVSTPVAIVALRSLVATIKTPLVDEMDAKGEISKVVGLLGAGEVAAVEVVMEVGYYGRKETLERMMEDGVVERLVELQRREEEEEEEEGVRVGGVEKVERRRGGVGRCVARFAIQVEVGEGLRRGWTEKSWFKVEVLRRVKEAAASEAEEATIAAEVLWGASP